MNETDGRQTNRSRKNFIFCTGIENSYPTIKGRDGKPKRIDQMEKCGHYERWREDFQLVRELGLDYLRYGPPYYKVHLAPGKYDWSFVDETFNELKRLNIMPITDLCHFGVPDWLGNFQNPDWAEHFAEYEWLMKSGRKVKPHCVMGNDYYYTNEHYISADGKVSASGEIFGYYVITKQYYDRYHLPVMHTETNLRDEKKAPVWLRKQWENMLRLRADGVPIIGFTWYSLTDQIDWDTALRFDRGRVNPLGLYDLDRKIRPVGRAYKKLVEQWRELLPLESRSLDMHASLVHKN